MPEIIVGRISGSGPLCITCEKREKKFHTHYFKTRRILNQKTGMMHLGNIGTKTFCGHETDSSISQNWLWEF